MEASPGLVASDLKTTDVMTNLARRLVSKHRPAAAVRTYATWNPADKGGGIVLSNGNRTVSFSTTPTDGGSVRSTIGKSSGKWYWEVFVEGSQSWCLPGVADSSAPMGSTNYYAGGAGGYGYYSANGGKYHSGGPFSYGTSTPPGGYIGVALDMDNGTLTFYRNGVSMGVAFTGLSGTFYAAEGNYTLNAIASTTNFGQAPFVYPPPPGFNPGLYIETGAPSYAIWNPADKGANVNLSNGNLSMVTTSTGGTARSTVSKSSGKWYWEVTYTSSPDLAVGIAKATASLTGYLGIDSSGYSYVASNGSKYNGSGPIAYGATFPLGTVIGIAMDLDAGTLTFYRNGVSQGVAFTGLSGTFFAAQGTNNNGGGCTANFGQTPFAYSPPAGFNAGLYA